MKSYGSCIDSLNDHWQSSMSKMAELIVAKNAQIIASFLNELSKIVEHV